MSCWAAPGSTTPGAAALPFATPTRQACASTRSGFAPPGLAPDPPCPFAPDPFSIPGSSERHHPGHAPDSRSAVGAARSLPPPAWWPPPPGQRKGTPRGSAGSPAYDPRCARRVSPGRSLAWIPRRVIPAHGVRVAERIPRDSRSGVSRRSPGRSAKRAGGAKPDLVVALAWRVVVAIGRAAVPGVVDPGAAPQDTSASVGAEEPSRMRVSKRGTITDPIAAWRPTAGAGPGCRRGPCARWCCARSRRSARR